MRKKIKLNIKFMGNEVVCAKSPVNCRNCKDKNKCENLNVFYYPYPHKDILNCFNNNEKRR